MREIISEISMSIDYQSDRYMSKSNISKRHPHSCQDDVTDVFHHSAAGTNYMSGFMSQYSLNKNTNRK